MSLIVDQVDAGSEPVRTAIISTYDLHWLAGILEGEGSFLSGPPSNPNAVLISCCMTDEDVISRIASLFGVGYCKVTKKKEHWKQAWRVQAHGYKIMYLMQILRPLMSIRRQGQIDKALGSFDSSRGRRRREVTRKLSSEQLDLAKERISSGESMRSVARDFEVNHESLRQRLLHGIPVLPDRRFVITPSDNETVYILQ